MNSQIGWWSLLPTIGRRAIQQHIMICRAIGGDFTYTDQSVGHVLTDKVLVMSKFDR